MSAFIAHLGQSVLIYTSDSLDGSITITVEIIQTLFEESAIQRYTPNIESLKAYEKKT